jgi:hypothetical protein
MEGEPEQLILDFNSVGIAHDPSSAGRRSTSQFAAHVEMI